MGVDRVLASDINIRFDLTHYGVLPNKVEAIADTTLADSVTSNNPIMPTKPEVVEIISSYREQILNSQQLEQLPIECQVSH